MTDMDERVARAIYEAWRQKDYPAWESSQFGKRARAKWCMIARAAISAMREPSEAMMAAGRPWAINDRLPPNCWIRMIDAALAED